MKRGQVQLMHVVTACQNYILNLSKLTRMAPTTLVGPPELKSLPPSPLPPPPPRLVLKTASCYSHGAKIPYSHGNPCLDFYFHVVPDTPDSEKYLNQLLPLAWSHNPLTTLKLICKLLCGSHSKDEQFYTAVFWLHHNHPKTLARNILPIAGWRAHFRAVLEILYGVLEGQAVNAKRKRMRRMKSPLRFLDLIEKKVGSSGCSDSKGEKLIAMAKKAVERYQHDPNYQLLHESVTDIYAECLKSDIQNLKKFEQQLKDNVNDPKSLLEMKVTSAARWCPSVDSFFDRATLLCESIARKVFPREEGKRGVCVEDEDEISYVSRVRERLMKEVLEPLRKAMESGFADEFPVVRSRCPVEKYLQGVKARGQSKIKADAMLPHEIICYVNDPKFGQLAEPQWKAMVEEIYLKQGKFKNSLAVCDVSARMCGYPMDVSFGLALLVSELTEELWKGKVFTFSKKPQLHLIQGHDLKSKCMFMRRMDNQDWDGEADFEKVFDLILEVAVNAKLKPEQMIKRVFVFTSDQDFDDASVNSWETVYEAIQSKFKEKGYGDVVPRLVFWNLNDENMPIPVVAPASKQGVAMLSGFSETLLECFLDNDGEIGPEHVVEAAISGWQYESLAVVD